METRRKAFTIVEILIVVLILGILAAIVIPQFSNNPRSDPPGSKATLDEHRIIESDEVNGIPFVYEQQPGMYWEISLYDPTIHYKYTTYHYGTDANVPSDINEWRTKILKKLGYLE